MYRMDVVIMVKTEKDVNDVKNVLEQEILAYLDSEESCVVTRVTDDDWEKHEEKNI